MSLELLHTLHSYYLEVKIRGDRTPGNEFEETAAIWAKIFQISKAENRSNILAHVRVKNRLPINAQINISFKLKEIGCTQSHRIGVIVYNKEVYKSAALVERYMQQEGFAVHLFRHKDKARRWLLHEKKKSRISNLLDSFS
ncbi:MAG: hypothetical protein OER83_04420 [Flavobacteriaceae bacterium]|nr:hypothetical protein [Flavobacteriaceae bacterium]MDH3796099.1 hypothetical protein [Flavobacteriaceae bacterium]